MRVKVMGSFSTCIIFVIGVGYYLGVKGQRCVR
jgi:hypothetical protein